jgi:hypothetical protein
MRGLIIISLLFILVIARHGLGRLVNVNINQIAHVNSVDLVYVHTKF